MEIPFYCFQTINMTSDQMCCFNHRAPQGQGAVTELDLGPFSSAFTKYILILIIMAWLLKAESLEQVKSGTIIGGILYAFNAPESDVLSAIKASPSNVYVAIVDADVDQATALLNAGAKAIVASQEQFAELVSAGIPSERIVIRSPKVSSLQQSLGGVVTDSENSELAKAAAESFQQTGKLIPIFRTAESEEELVELFTSSLSSDRADGLFTTVVTTPRHHVLGICYSSKESIKEAVKTRTGVYQSRKRGLWYKGATSGATQRLYSIAADCDSDALEFVVDQTDPGFCHNNTTSCFGLGNQVGLDKLESTIASRLKDAPEGSYTKRLVSEAGLLEAKIKEEAEELCDAQSKDEVAWEAADLLYFVSVKLAKHGMTFKDVENDLDRKSSKITRRKGDAKPKFIQAAPAKAPTNPEVASSGDIRMHIIDGTDERAVAAALRRPAQSSNAFDLARPIISEVQKRGDAALLEFTAKFEKAQLSSPVLSAPFPPELMDLEPALKESIDLACANIEKFHSAQLVKPLIVETSPGVRCSRFSRPIHSVGLYVPGGTAILPSTAIHLGVPAKVAGCKQIVVATPPRSDGTPSPEVAYVAHKIGAKQILLAGGAQAVAAMAYGTDSVLKVNKILGPGNQFVTAGKMICSTDVNAQVSIDMPAGPSEVLVIADKYANKTFVASDLLSQAEHGADSQVVLISIAWSEEDIVELQAELHKQATALPRCEVVRQSIGHSSIINAPTIERAMELSNQYAPEHLILQINNAANYVDLVNNAGSVFVGALSPESCGDYTSGTNHTLPTYGYANQYSGVNTDTYLKYITSQELSTEGLESIGNATVVLAEREGLQGHANAVKVRLAEMKRD